MQKLIYLTLKGPSEGLFRDKGSKFLAYAFPMASENDLHLNLQHLKIKHHQASHFCYAWRLSPQSQLFRTHDDGEPNHTAGTPILHAIQSADIWEIALVVVRYYGGTKLGRAGLVNAYKTAAVEALSAAQLEEKIPHFEFCIEMSYEQLPSVQVWINRQQVKPIHTEMGTFVLMRFSLPFTAKEAVDELQNLVMKLDIKEN